MTTPSLPIYPYPSIDCAGILKLRNSDIELRKGETDIGRKNTRVRLVFRVHVPQGNGKVVSIQVASVPIECCECTASRGMLWARSSEERAGRGEVRWPMVAAGCMKRAPLRDPAAECLVSWGKPCGGCIMIMASLGACPGVMEPGPHMALY